MATACRLVLIAIGAAASAALLGCGSQEPAQSTAYEANFDVSPAPAGSKTLIVTANGGLCVGEPGSRSRIESVEVKEADKSVTLIVHADREAISGDACADEGVLMCEEAHLQSPLGDREILNGRDGESKPVPVKGPGACPEH